MSSLMSVMRGKLIDAGLDDAELISSPPGAAPYGDKSTIFRIGPLLLRIVSERGQEFVDLASKSTPEKFHQFDDVEIAMGWRSVDEVLAKREPEPIESVLQRVKANM